MSSPIRVIIDTDPGVDDILALLFSLAASSEDIQVLLISVTFGNVDVQNCLRNVVSMFHVIEKEMQWRQGQGMSSGFDSLQKSKPLLAVGADLPIDDEQMMATYFHGIDGLGGVHTSHQHLTPPETWKSLFSPVSPETLLTSTAGRVGDVDPASTTRLFIPSQRPSHLEILRILEENPPDTISIIAIGPLTNIALAAAHSPQTLVRAKSVLVMGGAVHVPGNMSPGGEFNIYADATAAARVFALTSPDPSSTMPPSPPVSKQTTGKDASRLVPLGPYPDKGDLGSRRLNLILFPLDITTQHSIRRDEFEDKAKPLIVQGSPLAEWTYAFLGPTFDKMELLHHGHKGASASMSLHDPFCIWYALTSKKQKDKWAITIDEDIRVETAAQWTRGMCVVDRRDRKRGRDDDGENGDVPGDTGGWLSARKGNRLKRCIGSPGEKVLAPYLLRTIFG